MNRRQPARLQTILLAFAALLTAGCAGAPPPGPALKPVYLTDDKAVTLLPTRALDRPIAVRQLMEGHYGSQSYSFEAYVKADAERITMIAFSGFGTQVYSLTYRDSGIDFTAVPFAGPLHPEYLVADFQLCYFPAKAVASMVDAAGLSFSETPSADGWIREVRDGTKTILSIARRGTTIELENRLRGYGYTIREAEEDAR